jgi:hypothetical protein
VSEYVEPKPFKPAPGESIPNRRLGLKSAFLAAVWIFTYAFIIKVFGLLRRFEDS